LQSSGLLPWTTCAFKLLFAKVTSLIGLPDLLPGIKRDVLKAITGNFKHLIIIRKHKCSKVLSNRGLGMI